MQENKIQIQTRNSCNKGGHVRYQGGGARPPSRLKKPICFRKNLKNIQHALNISIC